MRGYFKIIYAHIRPAICVHIQCIWLLLRGKPYSNMCVRTLYLCHQIQYIYIVDVCDISIIFIRDINNYYKRPEKNAHWTHATDFRATFTLRINKSILMCCNKAEIRFMVSSETHTCAFWDSLINARKVCTYIKLNSDIYALIIIYNVYRHTLQSPMGILLLLLLPNKINFTCIYLITLRALTRRALSTTRLYVRKYKKRRKEKRALSTRG